MKIVMPLAGRGSKFISAGFKEPKPLIMIRNKPMVVWATDSIPFIDYQNLIFIVLDEHIRQYKIDSELKKIYGEEIEVIVTNGFTQGAASTVLLARDKINKPDDLIIYNTDQYFSAPLAQAIKDKKKEIKGLIPVFNATHPKWSYVRADENDYALETREKEPISIHATVGLYYFSKGSDFVWGAEEMISKNIRTNGEFYICPVYNELIGRGDKIKIVRSNFMWGLGTPEEVEHFEKFYKGDI